MSQCILIPLPEWINLLVLTCFLSQTQAWLVHNTSPSAGVIRGELTTDGTRTLWRFSDQKAHFFIPTLILLKEKLNCNDLPLLDRFYLNYASVNWTLIELWPFSSVHSVKQSVSLLKLRNLQNSIWGGLKSHFEENIC